VSKKNSLSFALESAPAPAPAAAAPQPATPGEKTAARTNPTRPPSREGKKLIGGHFAPEVQRALNVISAESGETIQQLLADALNVIFAKYGKPQIATLEPKK
jgi:hypothetical protein